MHANTLFLRRGCLLAALLAASLTAAQSPQPSHSAVIPAPRPDPGWKGRAKLLDERLQQTPDTQVLFIGDSITQGWEGAGTNVWSNYYAARKAVNLGIGGDRTQHVLWRLDHAPLDRVKPKATVVMIGTNNSNAEDNTPGQIAEGVRAIVKRIRDRLPQTKILLLAIFPRDRGPSPQRDKNAEASLLASRIADGRWIHYLDINQEFLTPDGRLSRDIMPDFLHPNKAGYEIWAKAVESKVKELMGERE